MSEREDEEVAVDTGTGGRRRRRLGPNPRPPSQWGTPDSGGGLGPRPTPPSQWAPVVPGASPGFGAGPDRQQQQSAADELAALIENTERDRRASSALRGTNLEARARPPYMPPEEPAAMTFEDFMGGYQFDSSSYDDYMNFLMQQDEETMARINAMYAQLADSAGANMQRVADVYDSARIQSGDVFGGSAQNIEDAYSSASQQAADQMARLGIEAAAPGVLDPMALSQAEAVSGIERAGAGAVDALTRYGASAQDFGGQMAQVGQQQGLEVSNQILRDMAQRQAEAAFMRSQAQQDYNPYARAMQEMQARQMFDQMQGGDPMAMVEEMRIAQDRALSMQDRYIKLVQHYEKLDIQTRGEVNTNPGETPEERAMMMLDLAGSDALYPLPMF